jgi:putative toxin-antitoxin system antitoxin component (TIGR02293 family)
MAKRKTPKKAIRVSKPDIRSGARKFVSDRGGSGQVHFKSAKSHEQHKPALELGEVTPGYAKTQHPKSESRSFSVTHAGKQKNYAIQTGFGYFIRSLRKAGNLVEVNELVEAGISSAEVEPIIKYLDLRVPDIARAAAVSTSTVSRWRGDSSIGVAGSNQFFRIDEVIRKGVDLFGGPEEFKDWLHTPNFALGNNVPAKLITSNIGVEMVDEALDALHYGNVM